MTEPTVRDAIAPVLMDLYGAPYADSPEPEIADICAALNLDPSLPVDRLVALADGQMVVEWRAQREGERSIANAHDDLLVTAAWNGTLPRWMVVRSAVRDGEPT